MKGKIFIALAFIFTLIFSATTAFAGTSGSTNTVTINVSTGSGFFKPYIVLSQNKAKASFRRGTKLAQGSAYAKYNIIVKKDGRKVSSPSWHSGSIKIKLDKNSNYTITVSYDDQGNYLSNSGHLNMFNNWIEQPYWSVTKESKIESCW